MNRTCLYSPSAMRHRSLAGTHCTYPRRDGQAELTSVAGYIRNIKCTNVKTGRALVAFLVARMR